VKNNPKLSGIPEIPLDPPFSKGEISTPLSESHQKSSPPFEREDGRDFWESFSKG
jgi:hypothetical protein